MDGRITITMDGGVAQVRLTRPDKLNALDPAMFAAIADAQAALAIRPDVRAVVLSGEGRAFSAGLDMAAMAAGPDGDLTARTHGPANLFQQAAWGWRDLPVPVIAALHGAALGGGLQIAAGADIRIAHPDTRLSIRELHWGIVPDMAGFALWQGVIRDDHWRELTYSARELTAVEGERLGLVTRLADDPLAEALSLATTIAGRNPDAVRAAKRLHALAHTADAAAMLAAESAEQARLLGSANQRAQVSANLARRPAVFDLPAITRPR